MSRSSTPKPTLFLSYNYHDTIYADIIEQQIRLNTNDEIFISNYTSDVKYKDSFRKFMDSIDEHGFVLCIVSDYYLKSKACMYEVGEVIKNHNYRKRILFIVLSRDDYKLFVKKESAKSAPDIYNVHGRAKYVKYWQGEFEKLKKEIKEFNEEEPKEYLINDLKVIGGIYRNDIGEFLNFLSDSKGKDFTSLYNSFFADIIKWIIPDWDTRLFMDCNDYTVLLHKAIDEISKVTHTDYNQIALTAVTGSHQSGLVVFADNISGKKQKYRKVAVNGLMFKAASIGSVINAKDVRTEEDYFDAVLETKSELVVPIKIYGNTIGIINSEAEEENYYCINMIERIETIANCLAVALRRLGYSSNIHSNVIPYIHI